jgi:hypothetical protein
MTVIKYRTSKHHFPGDAIEVVECERETDASVFVKTHFGGVRREAKMADWRQYHDSWEAARAYLIEREANAVACVALRLDRARAELAKMRSIPEAQP